MSVERAARALLIPAACVAVVPFAAAEPAYQAVTLSDGVTLTPALKVEQRFDDNIFITEENEVDSPITEIAPSAKLRVQTSPGATIDFSYAGEYGFYWDSSDDDYNDHRAQVDGRFEASRRVSVSGYLAYELEHDNRGTGPSNGFGPATTTTFDEPTTYDRFLGGAQLDLGARDISTVRGEFAFDYSTRDYDEVLSTVGGETFDITADRDNSMTTYRATGFYQVAPNTEVLAEFRYTPVEYDQVPRNGISLDSEETYYLVGVSWQATAKTQGTVKIGFYDKDFDAVEREDVDNSSWEVDLVYQPRSYSRIKLSSRQGPRETDGQGSAITVTRYAASWEHGWTPRITSKIGVSQATEEFEGNPREDDFVYFDMAVDYDVRPWLTLGGGFRYSERDSTQVLTDFNRNIFFLNASMGL